MEVWHEGESDSYFGPLSSSAFFYRKYVIEVVSIGGARSPGDKGS